MAPTTSTIPQPYRIFFTTIDPIIGTAGIFALLLFPNNYLRSLAPDAISPPSLETKACLDLLAGWFTACLILQILLLRARPHDVTVWRFLELSILITDIATLGAYARALHEQQRVHWVLWRAEEWVNIGVITVVAVVRAAFLMSLGMQRNDKKLHRKD